MPAPPDGDEGRSTMIVSPYARRFKRSRRRRFRPRADVGLGRPNFLGHCRVRAG